MKKLNLLIMVAVLMASWSCRKDPAGNTINIDYADVYVTLHHEVDGAPFQMGTVYTDDFGTQYTYSRAQIYMSNFDLSGTKLDEYLLVDTYDTTYRMGSAAEGHYHDLTFAVGVDSLTNHADPAQYSLDHPLALQTPSTHWGWSSGYLFIMLEGQVDTTGDGTMDDAFIFHVGGDMLYRTAALTVHKDVPAEGKVYVELDLNWAAFFDGVDLKNDHLTHTMNNMPLATAVANNVQNAFTIHQ